jgi:hypothetical protein
MSEPTALAGDLEGDLRRYFAVTTSTGLPRRVSEMSARTLVAPRRRSMAALLGGGLGALATAALVFVVATHVVPHGGASSSSLYAGAGSIAGPELAPSKAAAPVVYPGVDTTKLAEGGMVLAGPAGHGSAALTPVQAQADAQRTVGTGAGTPGPAVLVFAELTGPPASSSLCWAVDVPVRGGVSGQPAPAPQTELVLVDAVSGRIVAVLSGSGIP